MSSYLIHYGIKGQKWGERRFQNEDGSLTPEGRQRYLNPDGSLNKLGRKELGMSKYEAHSRARKDAENRFQNDIRKAEKNKKFISDVKSGVKKEYNKYSKNSSDYDYTHSNMRKDLKKKYPEFSELIDGIDLGESGIISNKKYLDNYIKSNKNQINSILNNDFNYDWSKDYKKYEPYVNDSKEKTIKIIEGSALIGAGVILTSALIVGSKKK